MFSQYTISEIYLPGCSCWLMPLLLLLLLLAEDAPLAAVPADAAAGDGVCRIRGTKAAAAADILPLSDLLASLDSSLC